MPKFLSKSITYRHFHKSEITVKVPLLDKKDLKMTLLNSLKHVVAKKPSAMPAIVIRRNKLSSMLYEQIQLATANKNGTTYAPLKMRTYKDEYGNRKQMEVTKRVRPMWFVADSGKCCLSIRYGARVLELAKGKNAVEVASADDLINALQIIKKAVEAGELDVQLNAVGDRISKQLSQ